MCNRNSMYVLTDNFTFLKLCRNLGPTIDIYFNELNKKFSYG